MKSLPWVQLRSMHRRHPGLPSLPAVVDASSSKKSLRCSNSMRLPIHSGTEIRISWDAKSSFASLSSIHGMIMGIQWYTNMKFSWLHSALSKYPRGSLFFAVNGWRSLLPGKGSPWVVMGKQTCCIHKLHGKSSNIKGLSKKECSTMQLKLTSHTPSRYQIMCQCIITTAAITAV